MKNRVFLFNKYLLAFSGLIFLFLSLLNFVSCKNAEALHHVVAAEAFEAGISNSKNIQLIDVRTKEEYDEGFIKGATLIDYFDDGFEKEILKLDKTKPVYLYCKSGGRSGKTGNLLMKNGFTNVYDLEGGYLGWKKYKNLK